MSFYDDDQPHDHGFDMPDCRWTGYDMGENQLDIYIHRRYFRDNEDPEFTDYACSFILKVNGQQVLHFPEHVHEGQAIECVYTMYEIDEERTREAQNSAIESWEEIRRGC
jgi:hypothetical protein